MPLTGFSSAGTDPRREKKENSAPWVGVFRVCSLPFREKGPRRNHSSGVRGSAELSEKVIRRKIKGKRSCLIESSQ